MKVSSGGMPFPLSRFSVVVDPCSPGRMEKVRIVQASIGVIGSMDR